MLSYLQADRDLDGTLELFVALTSPTNDSSVSVTLQTPTMMVIIILNKAFI